MLEELRREKPNPEELKQKLAAFQALRAERRREHRSRLHSRWGGAVLRADVKRELEQHGRRLARLRRMEVVASTERTGKQRTMLIGRIQKLRDLEEQRHHKAMQSLIPNAPGPTAGALPSALPLRSLPGRKPAPIAAPSASGAQK
jgi:hypothetical protein